MAEEEFSTQPVVERDLSAEKQEDERGRTRRVEGLARGSSVPAHVLCHQAIS